MKPSSVGRVWSLPARIWRERWVGVPVPAPVPARAAHLLVVVLGWSPVRSEAPRRRSLHLRHPRRSTRTGTRQRRSARPVRLRIPTKVSCRPALGLCGHLFLVGRRPRLVCCGRRRDGDVGFEDSNASRLLHGLSAIRTETTVVRRLVSVIAAIPVRHDPSLRPAASPTHYATREKFHGVSDSTRRAATVIYLRRRKPPATLMKAAH